MKCGNTDLWSFKMHPEEGYFQLVRDCSLLSQFQFDLLPNIYPDCCHDDRDYPATAPTRRSPPR
jgi:hypothetical protein